MGMGELRSGTAVAKGARKQGQHFVGEHVCATRGYVLVGAHEPGVAAACRYA